MRIHLPAHLPAPPLALPWAPVPGLVARCLARLRHWRLVQRELAEIERLDELTLRDIGLQRWEVRERLQAAVHGIDGLWDRRP